MQLSNFPYFIFNGIDSRQMGVWVAQYPDRVRAAERVNRVTIPGRPGQLTMQEGTAVYEPLTLNMRVQTLAKNDFEQISQWLNGEDFLILGRDPGKKYLASMSNEVSFAPYSKDISEANLQFICDPFKRPIQDDPPITLTSAGNIINRGNVPSKPIIRVFGSGTITLTNGFQTMKLKSVSTKTTIDCDAMMVTNNSDVSILEKTEGDFFTCPAGKCVFSWSGGTVTRVEIDVNPRWL